MEARFYEKHDVVEQFEEGMFEYPDIIRKYAIDCLVQLDPDKMRDRRYDLMLDAGCGNGGHTSMFAKHFKEIIGFDKSQEQINMANKKNGHDGIQYVVADENRMPASENTVDLIWSFFSIQYMNVETFVTECKRVLKPMGCAIIVGFDFADIHFLRSGIYECDSGMPAFAKYLEKSSEWYKSHFAAEYEVCERYTNVFHKISGIKKSRKDDLVGTITLSLDKLRKHILSVPEWNEFSKWMGMHHDCDPLDQSIKEMKKMWSVENKDDKEVIVLLKLSFFVLQFSK
ncbi:malonyl-[acyl-carrier protein] O-methyltransferase-like [Styela clava]